MTLTMASSSSVKRQSSLIAQKRMQTQLSFDVKHEDVRGKGKAKAEAEDEDGEEFKAEEEEIDEVDRSKKKRKTSSSKGSASRSCALDDRIFSLHDESGTSAEPSLPPRRRHTARYHRPLLLDSRQGQAWRAKLFDWFDTVSASRAMPWRKDWLDPKRWKDDPQAFRKALEKRAYEVWISEIMLQQTRVAVVIDYWNRWMQRWPTIQALASAEADDVLSAWRGLGYYSRATRIHQAAKKVVDDERMQGLLPATAEQLEKDVPGVGRYTGGAISAIVFGRSAPMVDGNVLRVMSRQMGLLANVKTDKAVIDSLWSAADALVKAVGRLDGAEEPSDRPGRWGQALMELGSTICTPKPNCSACPISVTCRAYAEGVALAARSGRGAKDDGSDLDLIDIEDSCLLCEPYEDVADVDADESESVEAAKGADKPNSKAKQATLSSFAFTQKKPTAAVSSQTNTVPNAKAMEVIIDHAKRFPVKALKKAVREEETLVCAIRRPDGRYLIQRRPNKGLLAGLWEFPSDKLPSSNDSSSSMRKQRAKSFVADVLSNDVSRPKSIGELGNVPWLFSHLKLTMHVHLFLLNTDPDDDEGGSSPDRRWATAEEVEAESMGTGMRKCWTLVRESKHFTD